MQRAVPVAVTLRWRHNDHDGVSNDQPHVCLLDRLFRRRSKKTSKIRVTGLCVGNSPGPVNSLHKGPVTRKMFPFDDVIMNCGIPDISSVEPLPRDSTLVIKEVLWRQEQASQAGISNYIPQYTVGCNYLPLPKIPVYGAKVLQCPCTSRFWANCSLNVDNKLRTYFVIVIFFLNARGIGWHRSNGRRNLERLRDIPRVMNKSLFYDIFIVTVSSYPRFCLTHWGRDKMDAILQTTFSNAFSWMKMFEFRFKFNWSVFPRVQLTIFQQWFR